MWGNGCDHVRPRLPLLAGGELAGPDRREAERHLIGCEPCRLRLESLREAMGALQAMAAHDPTTPESSSLWPALARQLRESRRPEACWERVEGRILVRAGVVLAAACLLLAAGVLSLWPTAQQYRLAVDGGRMPSLRFQRVGSARPAPARPGPTFRSASYHRNIRVLDSPTASEAPRGLGDLPHHTEPTH